MPVSSEIQFMKCYMCGSYEMSTSLYEQVFGNVTDNKFNYSRSICECCVTVGFLMVFYPEYNCTLETY